MTRSPRTTFIATDAHVRAGEQPPWSRAKNSCFACVHKGFPSVAAWARATAVYGPKITYTQFREREHWASLKGYPDAATFVKAEAFGYPDFKQYVKMELGWPSISEWHKGRAQGFGDKTYAEYESASSPSRAAMARCWLAASRHKPAGEWKSRVFLR